MATSRQQYVEQLRAEEDALLRAAGRGTTDTRRLQEIRAELAKYSAAPVKPAVEKAVVQ